MTRRHLIDRSMTALTLLATALTLVPLVSVFAYVLIQGLPALNLAFFTQLPAPVGETGGGVGNAVVGSAVLVLVALVLGVPLGILSGLYLSEYGTDSSLASGVRFLSDVLTGVPTIVTGIFIYALVVANVRHFSALSGGIALALILLPTVTRTTEEMMRLVPQELREAALALGVPEWRVISGVALRAALPGVLTGIMLGLARIAGETAPLLFTAFGNHFWPSGLLQPVAALPLQIFEYAVSPYPDWQTKAWGAALVLVVLVFAVNILARTMMRRQVDGDDA